MSNSVQLAAFRKPSAVEAFFNRALGFLVGLGIGPGYMQLLQVPGGKTGRVYSTPVNLLHVGGKLYLVAPRGRTQWVRNAEAAGEIVLKRGSTRAKNPLCSGTFPCPLAHLLPPSATSPRTIRSLNCSQRKLISPPSMRLIAAPVTANPVPLAVFGEFPASEFEDSPAC